MKFQHISSIINSKAVACRCHYVVPYLREAIFCIPLLTSSLHEAHGESFETLHLKAPQFVDKADVSYWTEFTKPRAVLVICPGMNGDGLEAIRDIKWEEFARLNNLGLMGISFVSDPRILDEGRGYPYAANGSGDLLITAIRQVYGEDLPLLLFGFSSGALFTETFVEWRPMHVFAWAAHATGYCGNQKYNPVPGLVSCGDLDETRYGGAIIHFKRGRAIGKPLLWLSLPRTSHVTSEELEGFVREYFSCLLAQNPGSGTWVDVDRMSTISEREAHTMPSVSGWLPNESLFEKWKSMHSP